MRACATTSRSVVGSSAMINGDSHNTAIAIIMRCNMPPLISNGYSFSTRAAFSSPTASMAAVSVASSAGFPSARQVSRAWVCMVCSGLKALRGFCMMVAILMPRRAQGETGLPSAKISPAVWRTPAGKMPSVAAQVNDFPLPLPPTNASTRPRCRVNDTPCTSGCAACSAILRSSICCGISVRAPSPDEGPDDRAVRHPPG